MAEPKKRIVVIGAGVTGLTTALLLSKSGKYDITVVAKHMPGDMDIEYASPWAGANYLPFSTVGTPECQWERDTWPELERLVRDQPEAGIHFQDAVMFGRERDREGAGKDLIGHMFEENGPWFKQHLPKCEKLSTNELQGFDHGIRFSSVCINTALYLPWLVSQLLKAGAVIKRGEFRHVSDAASVHHSGSKADLVLNCTGLSSIKLGGVEDKKLVPVRGQTVLVRNEPGIMAATSGTDDGPDELMYIMQRAAGGGTILGGCYQKGSWDSQIDYNLANRIMKRAVDVAPALAGGKGFENLDVIRHNVGLRPSREGGARVEQETLNGVKVVHSYGHGGYGYQTSYGCAKVAVQLVEQSLGIGKGTVRASKL